jgi:hypothetical protein
MPSNSSWTFLSNMIPSSISSALFGTQSTDQNKEGSKNEPLLSKQKKNTNAPTASAPTVEETSKNTEDSPSIFARLTRMISWTTTKTQQQASQASSGPASPVPSGAGSQTPSESGSSGRRSVTFGVESSVLLPKKPEEKLGEESTKALKQPNPKEAVVASAYPPMAVVNPEAQKHIEKAREVAKLTQEENLKRREESNDTTPHNPTIKAGPSVFETFAQQFTGAQNSAGNVINDTSKSAQSAVQGLTSLFENMGRPPAGPSSPGNNSQAPSGAGDMKSSRRINHSQTTDSASLTSRTPQVDSKTRVWRTDRSSQPEAKKKETSPAPLTPENVKKHTNTAGGPAPKSRQGGDRSSTQASPGSTRGSSGSSGSQANQLRDREMDDARFEALTTAENALKKEKQGVNGASSATIRSERGTVATVRVNGGTLSYSFAEAVKDGRDGGDGGGRGGR